MPSYIFQGKTSTASYKNKINSTRAIVLKIVKENLSPNGGRTQSYSTPDAFGRRARKTISFDPFPLCVARHATPRRAGCRFRHDSLAPPGRLRRRRVDPTHTRRPAAFGRSHAARNAAAVVIKIRFCAGFGERTQGLLRTSGRSVPGTYAQATRDTVRAQLSRPHPYTTGGSSQHR